MPDVPAAAEKYLVQVSQEGDMFVASIYDVTGMPRLVAMAAGEDRDNTLATVTREAFDG